MPAELFWEFHQQRQISEAGRDAARAKDKVDQLTSEVSAMRRKLEHLSLACQALWELLRDHTKFEEEHILQKMQEIDLRDGVRDGKIGSRPLDCPACHRRANSARQTCLYCGAALSTARQHLFE